MNRPESTLRPLRDEDRPFVAATWVACLRDAVVTPARLRDPARANRLVDLYLDRLESERARGLARCLLDVPSVLNAWIAWDQLEGRSGAVRVLHFVYVRKSHRQQRVATQLLEAAGFTADRQLIHTFPTKSTAWLSRRHVGGGVYLDPEEFLR